MWHLGAVLLVWVVTALLARPEASIAPSIAVWAAWTVTLFLPGVTALEESWTATHTRVFGIIGYMLLTLYYVTQGSTYTAFLPTDADRPYLWPSVYLMVNLVLPIALVVAGCGRGAVQRRGRE